MPDLLGFFLTGEKKSEYTETTTSMLYNPTTKDWDWQTIEALGLPKKIFLPIDRAGSLRGRLRPELAEELGISPLSARTTQPLLSPPSPARAASRSARRAHGRCSAWRRISRS